MKIAFALIALALTLAGAYVSVRPPAPQQNQSMRSQPVCPYPPCKPPA